MPIPFRPLPVTDLLIQLLERDTSKRFGCKPNGEATNEIRRHPWFASIDWVALDSKTITAPFIPDANKANFDASHELEELLLEDNPLKAKQRKAAFQENLTDELRQMEEQFTSYDFKRMQRRSYFPHNQSHLMSTATATSSGLASSRPATPAGDLRTSDIGIADGDMEMAGQHQDDYSRERMKEKEYP